ncbi:hypothetical protein [Nitrosomonas marina]|nr:hypothetical protein [Nitrosomonas marina]
MIYANLADRLAGSVDVDRVKDRNSCVEPKAGILVGMIRYVIARYRRGW